MSKKLIIQMSPSKYKIFNQLKISKFPVLLAPLAGVSDYPFRYVCSKLGADLTYVEMLSSIALSYRSKNTMAMTHIHHNESKLAVQITAANQDDMAKAVAVLNSFPFDCIDINMGCPVKKVVKTGCGSAALKDPKIVYDLVRAACENSDKPVSAKIRIGWDKFHAYPIEIADACYQAGAVWLTVHGRFRSDNYSHKVDLATIKAIKKHLINIPVIGNGNLFSIYDVVHMYKHTKVDGVMISRGALGNPWIFDQCRDLGSRLDLDTEDGIDRDIVIKSTHIDQWWKVVNNHIKLHFTHLKSSHIVKAKRFRKNLLWYLRGWSGISDLKNQASQIVTSSQAFEITNLVRDRVYSYYKKLGDKRALLRFPQGTLEQSSTNTKWSYESRIGNEDNMDNKDNNKVDGELNQWDPKYDMDRHLDSGV